MTYEMRSGDRVRKGRGIRLGVLSLALTTMFGVLSVATPVSAIATTGVRSAQHQIGQDVQAHLRSLGSADVHAAGSRELQAGWLPHKHQLHAKSTAILSFYVKNNLRCSLSLKGPSFRTRRWAYPRTTQQINLTFRAAATVRSGGWLMSMACYKGSSLQLSGSTSLVTRGQARGRSVLVGKRGPYMTVSLVTPVRNIGSGGGPVNPGFPPGQCTYYAWLMRPDIYNISVANGAPVGGQIPGDPYGRYEWDAFNWANLASHYGNFQVGTTPEVGSIMVEAPHPGNPYGHVAYVVQVLSPTDFITHEMNTYGDGDPSLTVYTVHRSVLSGMQFIYQVSVPTVPPPPPTTTPPPPPIPQYGPFTTGCTGSGCLHGIYSQPSWQGSYLGPVYAPVYITCYTTGADYKGDNEYDLLTTGGYVTDYYVILSGQESASQYGIPHC